MLWIKWAGLPELNLGTTTQGAKWEVMPDTGENAKPQQEKPFPIPNQRAAESCECQQGDAAHLPQGHSGGSAVREPCLSMWAERSLCSPLIFTYHCPKSICPGSNGSFPLAPCPAHKQQKLQLVCTRGACAQQCVKYHFRMGCM